MFFAYDVSVISGVLNNTQQLINSQGQRERWEVSQCLIEIHASHIFKKEYLFCSISAILCNEVRINYFGNVIQEHA